MAYGDEIEASQLSIASLESFLLIRTWPEWKFLLRVLWSRYRAGIVKTQFLQPYFIQNITAFSSNTHYCVMVVP